MNTILMILMLIPIILLLYVYVLLMMKISKLPMKILFSIMIYIFIMTIYTLAKIHAMYLFMIVIIYLSGLLVLFSYFISLMNELSIDIQSSKIILILLLLSFILWLLKKTFKFKNFFNNKMTSIIPVKSFKIYMVSNLFLWIFILFLLFLVLIISVKLCNVKKMSLRQRKK